MSAVAARPAATVLLLRDADGGIEVHMQQRRAEMDFGGRAYVFPGGSMDVSDSDAPVLALLDGVDLGATAARMHLDADDTQRRLGAGLLVCAIRELFEESGVLLGRAGDRGFPSLDALAASRRRLLAGGGLAAELASLRVRPAVEALVYCAHFVTPVGLPRRYDTRFFLAAAPGEQEALIHAGEAIEGGWFAPAAMLERADGGEALLMPPTRILLAELSRFADVRAAMSDLGRREVATILFAIDELSRRGIPDHLPGVDEVAAWRSGR